MHDQLSVTLEDADLLAEMELMTDLIIAASETDATMPLKQVDRVLGLIGNDAPTVRAPATAPGDKSRPLAPRTRRTAR